MKKKGFWITVGIPVLLVGVALCFNYEFAASQTTSQDNIGSGRSSEVSLPLGHLVVYGDGKDGLGYWLGHGLGGALFERVGQRNWFASTGVNYEPLPKELAGPLLVVRVDDSGSFWTPVYARLNLKSTMYFATNGTVEAPATALDGTRLGLCAPCRDGRFQGEVKYEWRGLVSPSVYRGQRARLVAEQAAKLMESVITQK